MSVKLIKGESLQFGTYGFEHINLPADRPKYWDTIKVAKIVDSKTFSEVRFGITLEKSPPVPPLNTDLTMMRLATYYQVARSE